MKTKFFKRVLTLALATAMVLTACGQKPAANTSETEKSSEATAATETTGASDAATETVIDKDSLPVLTLYPKDANLFSGLVTGHRSDYFAENGFQMEVWAYSDEKTNAMLTGGDVPDMMYVVANSDTLKTLIETDKIINFDDYQDQLPNLFKTPPNEFMDDNIELIRENYSAGTGGLYILPFGVGTNSTIFAQTGTFDRNVVKLKWDVYEAIGAPEITDMWQLIDVMEDMLAYQPALKDGTKMYGTFLDNGLDTKYLGAMWLWYQWHGYDRTLAEYLIEGSMITGEISSILEDDSLYKEGLKW